MLFNQSTEVSLDEKNGLLMEIVTLYTFNNKRILEENAG